MDVRLVADLPVLVAWPVVPSQCEPRPPWREIDDPARVAGLVVEALSLIDQEAVLSIVPGGSRRLEDTLTVDGVRRRLLGPACAGVGHPLGELAKLAEFVFGVASEMTIVTDKRRATPREIPQTASVESRGTPNRGPRSAALMRRDPEPQVGSYTV